MAEQLSLVRTNDFMTDAGTVSLINWTDGFEVGYDGWIPQGVPAKDGRIRETLRLQARGTAINDLAANLQKLADKSIEAQRYAADVFEPYAVWLRVQLDGETNPRQTLAHKIEHEASDSIYNAPFRRDYQHNNYTLGIDRPAWWEAVTPGTVTAGSVLLMGGTFAYGPIAGDMPARLARVQMQGLAASTALIWPNGQMWLGFRSDRYGTPSAWVSSYDVALGGTAASSAGDGEASGSAAIRYNTGSGIGVSRGTAVPYHVASVNMGSATGGTPAAMFGKFLVLLRAKASTWNNAGTVQFNVRLSTGYASDYGAGKNTIYGERYYPRVPVFTIGSRNNDIYHLHELGIVQFPPDRSLPGINYSDFTLRIYAETVLAPAGGSGVTGNYAGGTLFLDNLIFIPADDGYYSAGRDAGDASIANVYTNDAALVYQGNNWANDVSAGIVSGTARVYGINTPYYTGGIPTGTGIAVLAAHSWGTALNQPTWRGTVTLNTVSRWQGLRGAD